MTADSVSFKTQAIQTPSRTLPVVGSKSCADLWSALLTPSRPHPARLPGGAPGAPLPALPWGRPAGGPAVGPQPRPSDPQTRCGQSAASPRQMRPGRTPPGGGPPLARTSPRPCPRSPSRLGRHSRTPPPPTMPVGSPPRSCCTRCRPRSRTPHPRAPATAARRCGTGRSGRWTGWTERRTRRRRRKTRPRPRGGSRWRTPTGRRRRACWEGGCSWSGLGGRAAPRPAPPTGAGARSPSADSRLPLRTRWPRSP
mmetsp:Transcript_25743/g.55904  ORF Transcript_25743/g.55904 Transcript_25743/m.55904 type:complete len:254 (-) Transcript_25743:561-1322(-)